MYVQLVENGSMLESCYDDKAKELFDLYLDCFYDSCDKTNKAMGNILSRARVVSNRVRQIVYTWVVNSKEFGRLEYKLTVIYDYLKR